MLGESVTLPGSWPQTASDPVRSSQKPTGCAVLVATNVGDREANSAPFLTLARPVDPGLHGWCLHFAVDESRAVPYRQTLMIDR